ncbi:alpha/beta fold hydrolase [Geodermatophilus sp. URMC 64]
MLLPGLASTLAEFRAVTPALARRYDVLALDLPGQGRSPAVPPAARPGLVPRWPPRPGAGSAPPGTHGGRDRADRTAEPARARSPGGGARGGTTRPQRPRAGC